MTRADIRDPAIAWPSCTLGGWAAAWVAGTCSPDDVISALTDTAGLHLIVDAGAVTADTGDGALGLLTLLRGARSLAVRLPHAGDVNGLPPDPATTAAFASGEVLLVDDGRSGGPLALVPEVSGSTHTGHTDDLICRWTVLRYGRDLDLGALVSGGPSVGELEYQLRQAVRDAAEVIARLGGTRAAVTADLRDQLAVRTVAHRVLLPPHPRDDRPNRIIDTAARIDAIVDLATAYAVTPGDSARQVDSGDTELRRLRALTRNARAAAVNSVIGELLPTG
ncbi:serine/threonine protein kinase [Gordonia sp. ABSL1-1]|uniref:serine/threonine protein kinase n=1 Tax=Gordonia sp. ABSL1-1 TaxID=3053923 RepID=UPI002572A625|nr:serine/threonine protein kinase [Gordonia sp. ABSL1-1]MDL9935855.1 serine/threonine protein kinase [Gordonia sp. ABSL1-1]